MATIERGTLPANAVPRPLTHWRRSLMLGYSVIFGAIGTFSVWASVARLDGAAIASGVVTAESNRKTLQHLEGGIVREILVRDGDKVKRNQLLIRLDPTRIDTQGELYANQLAIVLAQEARLLAEFEQRDALVFPREVAVRQTDPAVAPVIADQRRLFETKRNTLRRNSLVAEAQAEQVKKEIEQARIDIATARATLEQVDAELNSLRPLFQRQLVPTTRIAPLERERLRLIGIVNGGDVQLAKLKERLDEATLKRQQVIHDYLQEASTQLLDVRKQLTEVRQQILLVSDTQKRADIYAPISGTVQQLRVFTLGGVIRPGDPILDIAPDSDELVLSVKVQPVDVDRVEVGMVSEIRFPGFNHWGLDVIRGRVRSISRDRIVEDSGRTAYFATEVIVDKGTVPQKILSKLTAGMTADVFIITGERTVANYLLQPLMERWNASMRER